MHNPSEIDFFLHFCIHTFAEHTQDHTFDTKERISGVWDVMENNSCLIHVAALII